MLLRPFYDGKPGYRPTLQRAMTDLHHELFEGHRLVFRPEELNPQTGPLMQQAVYDLTDKGREVAEVVMTVPQRDHERHRCMGACISLSLEQLGPDHGIIVHDQEYILAHKLCPLSTRRSKNPLSVKVSDGYYEPDKLLSFESKATGKVRFWIREDDRGTVGYSRADKKKNSNERKLRHQLEVLENRLYHSQWGIPNASFMWVMTKQADVENIMRQLEGYKYADRFFFKVLPQFSTQLWAYPKDPIEELFTPWQTVNGPKDITQP